MRILVPTLTLLFVFAGSAAAQEQAAAGVTKCTCNEDRPSYESLRCPTKAPADPSPCERINKGLGCKDYRLPKGLGEGFRAGSMESFLLRHAIGWQIECSMCATTLTKGKEIRNEHQTALDLAKSMRKIGGKRIHTAMSPNFIMISDIRSLKIATRGGGARAASRHEILHLYLQRAEMARRDFVKTFGEPVPQRTAMVIVKRETTMAAISKKFYGSKINVLRGGGTKNAADGHAGNGFNLAGKNDDNLHFRARHMIGHILLSCYRQVQPHRKYCPHWMDVGCAHWLCKLHPRAKNFATFCQHEGAVQTSGGGRGGGGRGRGGGGGGGGGGGPTVSGSGANWDRKAAKIARRGPRRDPVEAMFQAQTAKQMDFDMHVRSWSWFDVFAAEEQKPFVDFIYRLRNAEEPRIAAKAAWGQAPEIVDDRWRERVTGKRKEVGATSREKQNEKELDEASNRELKEIAQEEDLHLLASRIRGLESARNVPTARLLISLADSRDSHRVREVIALMLERTDDAKVLEYLVGKGYKRAGKIGRAILCRTFGVRKYEKALPTLRKAMSDGFWLVKANAVRALAQLGDKKSMPAIAKMAASSGTGKLRCAAMDALGLYGKAAEVTIPTWERNLMHATWQVKVATCDAFRTIGSTKALDMLIGRLDSEGGRVHDEIRTAIGDLTGMERDWSTQQWMKWWNHTKKFADLEKRMKEILEAEKKAKANKPKHPTGNRTVAGPAKKKKPTYYGIKVYARAVGYVLDISASMRNGFRVSPGWQQRLGRTYKAGTRIGVCKEELAASIAELDPRTRLNLYFFNTRARKWKPVPVAAGAMGSNAISAVKNVQPERETNYFDAIKLVLGMEGDGGGWTPNFADTPDTLLFLTDGTPTDGEITKSEELLSWFNERNRFARLKVNVVAMGNTGVDLEFLQKFATENGGKFIHLTGDY